MKKKVYAIYNMHGKFIKEKEVTNQQDLQQYLNEMSKKNKKFMAIHLKGSNRKLSSRNLKKLEIAVRKEKIYLNRKDHKDLTMLIKVLKERPARYGMIIAGVFDTAIREIIPLEVWEAMGGEVNK